MNLREISILRFKNQLIAGSKFTSPREIAGWMGALQAQDFKMSKWAFGIRLKDSAETTINKAIDSGDIVRMHLLRPTWHFVSSDDVYWISELTAAKIKAAMRFRDNQLGLTEAIFRKSNSVIEKSLRDGNHLSREELISTLRESKIDVGENRASHLFLRAEMEGIICSGRLKNSRPAYALLSEWVKKIKILNRDESLKELARRYFSSHGPASLEDFEWWSGLSLNDSKKALEYNRSDLTSETFGNQTYWFENTFTRRTSITDKLYLLPAYDDFLISYRDRRAPLTFKNQKGVVSKNGVFYPTIVLNGRVIGIWKYAVKNDKVTIEINPFEKQNSGNDYDFSGASAQFADFIDKKAEIVNFKK